MPSDNYPDDDIDNTILVGNRRGHHFLRSAREEEDDDTPRDTAGRRQRQRTTTTATTAADQGVFADQEMNEDVDDDGREDEEHTNTPPTRGAVVYPPTLMTTTTNKIGIVAALNRLYPAGYDSNTTKEELKMQTDVKGDNQAITAFRAEILQHQGLTAFAFLQPKDATIHIMHSAAPFFARGATGPLKGKDIGFVGDRSEYSHPAPIVLQPEKPWKWIVKHIVTDPTVLEFFYCNPANAGKFFTPEVGAETQRVAAPRFLLLPGKLVQYCSEAPRTPWDLHRQVESIVGSPGSGYNIQHYQLVIDWCCLAMHNEYESSVLHYDLQAAASNEVFQKWARTRIDATLGPATTQAQQQQTPRPLQDLTQLSTIAAEFGKGVIEALRPPNATAPLAVALGGGGSTATEGKEYDAFQKAILCGFSHTPGVGGLQPIWSLFSKTKSIDTHRLHLREAMNRWARLHGVACNKGLFLTKAAIEDIVNLRFNPGGSVAYYATAEKGLSLLLCRSRPGEERELARQHEIAEEISGGNVTLSEALNLGRNAPRPPPDTYSDLKTCIGTYCAMLWTLFGNQCEYFQKLHELYTCLESERVEESWANFSPLLCRQITWAIIDDGREYFAMAMLPDKFLVPPGAIIRYPQSSLEELIRPIKTQTQVLRANFPTQWAPRHEVNNFARNGPGPATAASGNLHVGTVISATRSNNNNNTRTSGSTASTASTLTGTATAASTQQSRLIRQTNVHPMIKALMEPFILRHGQLQLTRVMMVAGIGWASMPKIDRFVVDGVNNLCYNYILGKCTSRYCTHRTTGHIPATSVPDDFATKLCTVLKPGVDNMTEALMTAPWPEFQTIMGARRPQQE